MKEENQDKMTTHLSCYNHMSTELPTVVTDCNDDKQSIPTTNGTKRSSTGKYPVILSEGNMAVGRYHLKVVIIRYFPDHPSSRGHHLCSKEVFFLFFTGNGKRDGRGFASITSVSARRASCTHNSL